MRFHDMIEIRATAKEKFVVVGHLVLSTPVQALETRRGRG
jgi:hypothetical protein